MTVTTTPTTTCRCGRLIANPHSAKCGICRRDTPQTKRRSRRSVSSTSALTTRSSRKIPAILLQTRSPREVGGGDDVHVHALPRIGGASHGGARSLTARPQIPPRSNLGIPSGTRKGQNEVASSTAACSSTICRRRGLVSAAIRAERPNLGCSQIACACTAARPSARGTLVIPTAPTIAAMRQRTADGPPRVEGGGPRRAGPSDPVAVARTPFFPGVPPAHTHVARREDGS